MRNKEMTIHNMNAIHPNTQGVAARMGLLVLLALVLALPLAAQKVMVENSVEERSLPRFGAINVSGAIDVYISREATTRVVVTASDDKIRNNIQTQVIDGVLSISYKSPVAMNMGKRWMRVYLAVPTLSSIVSSGSSDVYVDGSLEADELEIVLSGASDFNGAVKARKLRLVGSGSADFKISGQAEEAVISVSGASDVSGRGLQTYKCTISASGSSDVHIGVRSELVANASGASDIRYYGNPAVKEVKTTSASTIRQVN